MAVLFFDVIYNIYELVIFPKKRNGTYYKAQVK